MKRVLAFALSIVIAVCIMGPTTVYAEECDHNFDWGFESGNESDICTKCGAIRPDIDAPYERASAKLRCSQYLRTGNKN